MGADLDNRWRAAISGYAGLAGPSLLTRLRPIAIIIAVDALAVALAFGALHITGQMIVPLPVGDPLPATAAEPLVGAVDGPARPSLVPDRAAPAAPALSSLAPAVVTRIANADILFAPVIIEQRFSGGSSAATTVAAEPVAAAATDDVPPSDPDATQTLALIDTPPLAADGSLDRLLFRGNDIGVVGVVTESTTTATASIAGDVDSGVNNTTGLAADANVASAATTAVGNVTDTVAAIGTAVTAPVSDVAGNVVGLLN